MPPAAVQRRTQTVVDSLPERQMLLRLSAISSCSYPAPGNEVSGAGAGMTRSRACMRYDPRWGCDARTSIYDGPAGPWCRVTPTPRAESVGVMAAVGCLSMALGTLNFGLFIKPMGDELGIGRATFGWAQSARQIASALTALKVGSLLDLYGARVLLTDATQPPSMAPSPSGCSRNKKIPTSTDRGAGRR